MSLEVDRHRASVAVEPVRAHQLGRVVLPRLDQAGDQLGAFDGHGVSLGGPMTSSKRLPCIPTPYGSHRFCTCLLLAGAP